MADSLVVRLHGNVVGELIRGQDPSRVKLAVDSAYDASGITLTESFTAIPGTQPPTDAVSNFLGGHVPEGIHRTVMASRRGIDPGDLFALLREFGGSLAGAVTVRPTGPAPTGDEAAWHKALTDGDLSEKLRQAVRDTDQAVPDDSRSTLPGFQPKVLASRAPGGWAQPHGGAHSTHILKPQVPQRATRLVDEYYGHLLARAANLASFSSTLLEADGVTFLAIERFDRLILSDGAVELVHQEDLAQALGLDWRTADAKFQDQYRMDNPARASAARVAHLLAEIPGASRLIDDWVRRSVFSLVLGDNDAHAKNIALLHTDRGTSLAPAYDTVPNLFERGMINEGFRLAYAVNGSFDHRRVTAESLVAEVASWQTTTPSRASSMVESALKACADAVRTAPRPAGLSAGLTEKLDWTVEQLAIGNQIGTSPWQGAEPK
ncbi:MAG: hypothetical protein F2836_05455 [Actinobacteria bacterium]|uniref:Unannotated protein n=1 Tax=freshwater metagenome TaxID=449393 RepID=A0A6J7J510_9ZZZZ|nr:hypothetical protein [Actinomycetota bacterium]